MKSLKLIITGLGCSFLKGNVEFGGKFDFSYNLLVAWWWGWGWVGEGQRGQGQQPGGQGGWGWQ